ncbi:TolC family protein, partial [bacterium]|nr:TolC family protein [bacterium]
MLFCTRGYAIEEVKEGDTLSLQDCIDLALEHSHDIKIQEEYVKMYASRVGQSKSVYFPTLGGSVGYDYNGNENRFGSTHSNTTSARASLNQLLYSFGKVFNQVKMQKFYKISAEYD